MTDEQIDLALAAELFGWTSARITRQNRLAGQNPAENYAETMERPTQSWIGMQLVVEAMEKRGWVCRIEECHRSPSWICAWKRRFDPISYAHKEFSGLSNTAPRAVAEATLNALREGAA